MAFVSIRLAESSEDFDSVRALCQEWLDWHWRNYPKDWPVWDNHPMDPKTFAAIVEDLPQLHARPKGGIVIGSVEGQPVGCVMYSDAGSGVAEFKRMFVSEQGRGCGVGRLMLEQMFEQMRADGYRKVFFSSATFLTHARKMYEGVGFESIPHPAGFPANLRERVYFMERSLV